MSEEEYFMAKQMELSHYIHLNPVRAKLVEKPQDYPYSSYSAYISREKTEIVYRDLILGMVSKSKKEAIYTYKNFVDMAIGGELEDPLKNVYGGISYSAIAKVYWRFLEKLKKDEMLRKKIAEIMSYVKG